MPNRSRRPWHSRRGCRWYSGYVVVMPLAADCVPLGSVKSTVPPGVAADASQAQEQRVRRARASARWPNSPGLTVRPLNCWLLVVLALPWIARVPPPRTKEEALLALLMMLAVGAPGLAEIELERAGGDGRSAAVGVAARQGQNARPICVRLPVPLMDGENITASPWLKTRLALSNTPLVPPIEAPLPPLPTCNVPAEIVVPPP